MHPGGKFRIVIYMVYLYTDVGNGAHFLDPRARPTVRMGAATMQQYNSSS